jgi:hypothetical protein
MPVVAGLVGMARWEMLFCSVIEQNCLGRDWTTCQASATNIEGRKRHPLEFVQSVYVVVVVGKFRALPKAPWIGVGDGNYNLTSIAFFFTFPSYSLTPTRAECGIKPHSQSWSPNHGNGGN